MIIIYLFINTYIPTQSLHAYGQYRRLFPKLQMYDKKTKCTRIKGML